MNGTLMKMALGKWEFECYRDTVSHDFSISLTDQVNLFRLQNNYNNCVAIEEEEKTNEKKRRKQEMRTMLEDIHVNDSTV